MARMAAPALLGFLLAPLLLSSLPPGVAAQEEESMAETAMPEVEPEDSSEPVPESESESEEERPSSTKDAKISRSGWAEGEEPSDRCHATLVDTLRTCCWKETEHRVYTTRSKTFTRWACADLHENYKDCLEVAHRYSYPGKAESVHMCTKESHNYFLYYLEIVFKEGNHILVPTEEMLPVLDVSLQHALERHLNVTHRAVVIAQGSRLDLLNGDTMQGIRVVFHFTRDTELEELHDRALETNSHLDLPDINHRLHQIAIAIQSENALTDMGGFAHHMTEEMATRPLVSHGRVSWLNVTIEPAEHVTTQHMALDASVRAGGSAGLASLLLAALVLALPRQLSAV